MPERGDQTEIDNDNYDDCLEGIDSLFDEFGAEGACALVQNEAENSLPIIQLNPNGMFIELSFSDDEVNITPDNTVALILDNGKEITLKEIEHSPEPSETTLQQYSPTTTPTLFVPTPPTKHTQIQNLTRTPLFTTARRLQNNDIHKSPLDLLDETIDAIKHTDIQTLLTPLKTIFRKETPSPILNLVIQDFQKLATAFKEDPEILKTETKKMFENTLSTYNEYDKTKLSLQTKTVLAMVLGGLIGAAIGFAIGVLTCGIGCIPALCIGAAVGCALGAGSSTAVSLTFFGSKYEHLNGASHEKTEKHKSSLSKKLHLSQTLNTLTPIITPTRRI